MVIVLLPVIVTAQWSR